VKVLVVVKDDPDVRFLVETIFSMDARFTLAAVASSAEEALESLRTTQPEIIVIDHGLSGQLTGLDGAVTKRAGSVVQGLPSWRRRPGGRRRTGGSCGLPGVPQRR
jgi:DNA-binding NarL/FixJ family response regulator